jgi:hypothetical protein
LSACPAINNIERVIEDAELSFYFSVIFVAFSEASG